MNRIPSIEATLLSQVLCNVETQCWEWQGAKDKGGYGKVKNARAHRVFYELYHKEPAGKLFVCHECDNPGCVNPEHLFLGTALINKTDCVLKERAAEGEINGYSKLTDEVVVRIREMYAYDDVKVSTLSELFSTELSNIRAIVYGERWQHVGGPISPKAGFGKKVTAPLAIEIYKECRDGLLSIKELAEKYDIAETNIRGIANGLIWAHATGAKPGDIDLDARRRARTKKARSKREAVLEEGAQPYEAIVNEAIVLCVRHLRNDLNWPMKKISAQIGIPLNKIADISLGNSWIEFGGTIRNTAKNGGRNGQALGSARSNAKMTEEKVQRLRELHSQGWTNRELQAEFGIGAASVSNIANRKTWRHVA